MHVLMGQVPRRVLQPGAGRWRGHRPGHTQPGESSDQPPGSSLASSRSYRQSSRGRVAGEDVRVYRNCRAGAGNRRSGPRMGLTLRHAATRWGVVSVRPVQDTGLGDACASGWQSGHRLCTGSGYDRGCSPGPRLRRKSPLGTPATRASLCQPELHQGHHTLGATADRVALAGLMAFIQVIEKSLSIGQKVSIPRAVLLFGHVPLERFALAQGADTGGDPRCSCRHKDCDGACETQHRT